MPALIKPTPFELKQILEKDGWNVHQEDDYVWSMVKPLAENSLEIPKKGKLVTFQVLENALAVAEMPPGRYLELRQVLIPPQQVSFDSHIQ